MRRRGRRRCRQASAAEIAAASDAFRRAHELLSSEEMEAWLAERGLTTPAWNALVRRTLRRARRRHPWAGAPHAQPEDVALMVAAASRARRSVGLQRRDVAAVGRGAGDAAPAGSRPHVVTRLAMDCGAAAVATVCRFHGLDVSLGEARRAVGSDATGTTLIGMVRGARALGLGARSVKVSRRNLANLPLPAIVHLDGDHWMVLYEIGRQHLELSDPAVGPLRLSRPEFDMRWSGYAVLLGQAAATMSTSR